MREQNSMQNSTWDNPVRDNPQTTIVVPCWNEEAALEPLLQRLDRLVAPRHRWEVLFVNDGSTDKTAEILNNAAKRFVWARVAHHETNLGLGAAIRTGFQNCKSEVICTIDSDGTYPPERLPEFVELIVEGADVVTASPWHPENREAEGGLHRIFLSRAVSFCYRLLTGSNLYTYTALFRAYRREVLEEIQFDSNGFSAVTEILIKLLGRRCTIAEVPMPLKPRELGVSKMSTMKAIQGHLRLLTLSAQWARR
jgi:dolichol-phosphate mannosyltransferase